MIYSAVEDIIGDTPLLKLDSQKLGAVHTDVYVKLEYLNPFGSIKDRTVRGMIDDETLQRLSDSSVRLIESSSGNTAKAMQLFASTHGMRFTSVTNRIKVPEVEEQLRYLGADIIALPGRSECADPHDPDDAVGTIKRMVEADPKSYFHTSQYTNMDNRHVHEQTTARELYDDLDHIDTFITGVGTGGSSGGIIDYAKGNDKPTRFVGVMSEPNDFLPGIRTRKELFETELFHQQDFDHLYQVTSTDALVSLRELVLNYGVLAGPTTGANFAAVRRYLNDNDRLRSDGSRQTIVFLACDRLESYMSYIKKRQPHLFGIDRQTDIYTTPNDDTNDYEIPVNDETVQWIQRESVLLVDTRGVRPFGHFHIAEAVNYPEELLREALTEGTPFSRSRKILLVCPTGERSRLLMSVLRGRGFDAYSLAGGMYAWRRHSLPFVRDEHDGAK